MDPTRPDAMAESVQSELEEERVYLSCSAEDLIEVEMEAWRQGYQAAESASLAALQSLNAVAEAGEGACRQALSRYVPLDVTRFTDVFVRAWCGGYCTRARELKQSAAPPTIH